MLHLAAADDTANILATLLYLWYTEMNKDNGNFWMNVWAPTLYKKKRGGEESEMWNDKLQQ